LNFVLSLRKNKQNFQTKLQFVSINAYQNNEKIISISCMHLPTYAAMG